MAQAAARAAVDARRVGRQVITEPKELVEPEIRVGGGDAVAGLCEGHGRE